MELINCICRKGAESGQHFHIEELQKSMVSDVSSDCLENFVISNAKKKDLITQRNSEQKLVNALGTVLNCSVISNIERKLGVGVLPNAL